MTVWSSEKLADVKRYMRLPRGRSSPKAPHLMVQLPTRSQDAGVATASSLSHGTLRGWTSRTSLSAQPGHSSHFPDRQSQNAVRHRAKTDLLHTVDLQNEAVVPRRSRQAISAGQPDREVGGDVGKVNFCAVGDVPLRQHASAGQPNKEVCGDAGKVNFCATSDVPLPSWAADNVLLGSDRPDPMPNTCEPSIQQRFSDRDENAQGQNMSSNEPATGIPLKKVNREPSSGPRRLSRQLSFQSEEAMRQLADLDAILVDIEKRVEQLSRLASEPTENVGQLKSALAQAEAEANKLETKGVDSIYTSELKSGFASAKDCKKAQLQRLERLFGVIEDVFSSLNTANRGGI